MMMIPFWTHSGLYLYCHLLTLPQMDCLPDLDLHFGTRAPTGEGTLWFEPGGVLHSRLGWLPRWRPRVLIAHVQRSAVICGAHFTERREGGTPGGGLLMCWGWGYGWKL